MNIPSPLKDPPDASVPHLPSEPAGTEFDPVPELAAALGLPATSVRSVIALMAQGGTVPFIARYRKEATGGLDEVQIRDVSERHSYLTELHQRRGSILAEIGKQGKLTPELKAKLLGAQTKAELEDLYLPFKPKRRTRAILAKERGLEPLATLLWDQPSEGDPEAAAASFVDAERGVPTVMAALQGARDICAERIAESAELRRVARESYVNEGRLEVSKVKEYVDKPTKFDNYGDFSSPVRGLPSHRFLAIRRGESEGVLRARLQLEPEPLRVAAEHQVPLRASSPFATELRAALNDGLERILLPSVQVDVRVELKLEADREAIDVFAKNLRELLLAPPLGARAVLGVDPGQRTGCKCAVVDTTGRLLAHDVIHLVQGESALLRARQTLRRLCTEYGVRAVAVGNGTHGRETEGFVKDFLRQEGLTESFCVSVNEAGASIYSASDIAREEFPDLDLTVRGAISIARRLQDPLAELVKIDPKSIGVGQYQHDVYQPFLARKLDEVVESCVNGVGVELNTASAPLLARVAGMSASLAKRVVAHRDARGPFESRKQLLEVTGLGPRTFEQAAAFLRIHSGKQPLDASAVHPERYELVERMAEDLGVSVASLIGDPELLRRLKPERYQGGDVGQFTVSDILTELAKPGRDPRASFERPQFRDDVRTLADVQPGMRLEGVVTNVTAFGAFVDVGVHQDGLVHISELADQFVKVPSDVVKVGDRLSVRVLEVDLERRRISLSARSGSADSDRTRGKPAQAATGGGGHKESRTPGAQPRGRGAQPPSGRAKGSRGAAPEGRGCGASDFQYNPFADLLKR